MRETVTKRVYCKQAVFLNAKNKSILQAKLSESLSKLKKVGARKEKLGEDGRYIRAVIYHRNYAGMLFGILASYEKGTHQLTVVDDDEAEMLTVDQVAPQESDDNKRQEFLEGVCYFGVSNNHVILVPSRALGAKPTEHYLNWLLTSADMLEPEDRIALSDQIAQATKEKIRTSHVKEVEIGAPLIEGKDTNLKSDVSNQKITAFEYGGLGIDILKQVLGNKFDSVSLSDAIDGNIEVTLKVKYKRATTENAHKFLDNIALAIRNIDEDEVKISLVGGGTIKGNDLKLSSPISAEAKDGIPNPDELFEKMRAWLLLQIENKIIEP